MKFSFSEEQTEFRNMLRRFLGDRSPTTEVRRVMETESGYDAEVWRVMAEELGVAAIHIPEAYGGAGFGVSELAIAAEEVPAGAYTRESLALLGTSDAFPGDYASVVLSNVVTNETSVRGVAQKVALGEVDAGIVYETDALAAQYAGAIRTLEIPLQFNPAAQYPIAALSSTDELETALEFIKFVQGDSGQAILRDHGFVPPANITCPCHAG